MVNQQLREYVKQQTQLGVSKDTMKSSLLGVGWSAADIAEVLSSPAASVSAPSAAMPTTPVISTSTAAPGMARDVSAPKVAEKSPAISFGGMRPSVSPAGIQPAAVSAPAVAANKSAPLESQNKSAPFFSVKAQPMAQTLSKVSASLAAPLSGISSSVSGAGAAGKKGGHSLLLIVMGAVTALSLGTAGFLWWKGSSSSSAQTKTLISENTSLTQQVAALTGKANDLTTKANTLEADNKTLTAELSIFITAGAGSSGEVAITVRGTLAGGGKTQYVVTTPHGIMAYVKNWKDAKVDAALAPFAGKDIEIGGTHIPGYRDITVTSVNGQAIAAPASAGTNP